ncbi:MAG: hypothetical protein KDA85_15805 [Planctomycetaceae bacterium]|nr:hypothetical protein [Planctomycetaceae bacterium]
MVLLVIGVISAIAVPRFTAGIQRHRLEGCLQMLQAELQSLRDQAMTASDSRVAQFDIAESALRTDSVIQRDGQTGVDDVVRLAESPWYCQIDRIEKAQEVVATGAVTVSFNGAGVANTDLQVTIRCGQHRGIVRLDRFTGRVSAE